MMEGDLVQTAAKNSHAGVGGGALPVVDEKQHAHGGACRDGRFERCHTTIERDRQY